MLKVILKSVFAENEVIVELWLLTTVLVATCRLGTLPMLSFLFLADHVLLSLDPIRSLQRCEEHLIARHLALIWE